MARRQNGILHTVSKDINGCRLLSQSSGGQKKNDISKVLEDFPNPKFYIP